MHKLASAALAKGVDFLLSAQAADGLWRDFLTPAGEASTWPTAYIGHALHLAGADASAVRRAAGAIAGRQQADGGWGYNEETPGDADSTTWAVLFLTAAAGRDRACERAGECLARYQQPGGGVATYAEARPIRRYMGVSRWVPFRGWCRPHVEVSAAAGLAFLALGAQARASAAWRHVRARQNADGSWDSYWWTSRLFAIQQAVTLAREMGDVEAIRRATAWIVREGDAPTSSFEAALALCIRAANGERPRIEPLIDLQQDDGGWPSDAEMRIPLPIDTSPAGDERCRRLIRFSPGIVVRDQHRTFTTATCVGALARARR